MELNLYLVADTRTVLNLRAVCVFIRESVYMKMRQLLSRIYQSIRNSPTGDT